MYIFFVWLSWVKQNHVVNYYNNSLINLGRVQDLLEGEKNDFCIHEVELGVKSFEFLQLLNFSLYSGKQRDSEAFGISLCK